MNFFVFYFYFTFTIILNFLLVYIFYFIYKKFFKKKKNNSLSFTDLISSFNQSNYDSDFWGESISNNNESEVKSNEKIYTSFERFH